MKPFDESGLRKTMGQLGFASFDITDATRKARVHVREYNEHLKEVINELDPLTERVRATNQDCGARNRREESRMAESENRRY